MKALVLSQEFNDALDIIENTRKSVFITGRAGTGKSTLLGIFRRSTSKKVVVLAPTGVAALHVKGQTIHSFFGFAPKMINPSEIRKGRRHRFFKKLDCIVIDEISMVRADLLDNIDCFLQVNREIAEPFGGVQMVFFGDLFQLPPVVATSFEKQYFQTVYESPFFFSAKVFERGFDMGFFELNEVYRQEERRFIRLLDSIRKRSFDYDDLEDLNQRYIPSFSTEDFYITLCSRNNLANRINQLRLDEIDYPERNFTAKIEGTFQEKLFPTALNLNLKKGAQVMFIKNDVDKKYVNGTIGKIVRLNQNGIFVELEKEDGNVLEVKVEREEWELIKYEQNVNNNEIQVKTLGVFSQYPLRLAWAITIHKSQGKTFDKVIIDLGKGAFESGQTYVALSRCRTLDGIVLKNPVKPRDILVDERIISFYELNR